MSTALETSTFAIYGMTCESCVRTVKEKIAALPGVVTANVSLENGSAEITAPRHVGIEEIRRALSALPKYTVSESTQRQKTKSFYQTYKPLFILFVFIILSSAAFQIHLGSFDMHLLMNHLMAGFFIGFSFLKFLNLKAFAQSFAGYDPIARRWQGYGYLYPFIELALGLMFIAGVSLKAANVATIVILSVTTVGVIKRLRSKSAFQCACLGSAFDLPLSYVTVAENVAMIAMAAFSFAF